MYKCGTLGNFLEVQWLGLSTFTAWGPGSMPGWETKILQAARCGKKKNIYIYIYIILINEVVISTCGLLVC